MREPSQPRPVRVLAIDPGTAKWGLAVVEEKGNCLFREVVPAGEITERIAETLSRFGLTDCLLGDRTGAGKARSYLETLAVTITMVTEHRTTLIGRSLYWKNHPPRGWRRLMPLGLLTPPEPLDAYAAEALALRYYGLLKDE